jgi:hypothetical protein
VRSSASTAGSRCIVAHQHPASCLQLNGAPHCGHFFSTVVGTGFGRPLGNRLGKSMAFHGLFHCHFGLRNSNDLRAAPHKTYMTGSQRRPRKSAAATEAKSKARCGPASLGRAKARPYICASTFSEHSHDWLCHRAQQKITRDRRGTRLGSKISACWEVICER